jgi:hypothetical protein
MTRTDKSHFVKWAQSLSDEELEKEYYDSVFASLGSEAEEMYERGYDLRDVIDRERYEKDLIVKSNILGRMCEERGIKLWEEVDPCTE